MDFHGGSRSLQDRYDTRRIADRIDGLLVKDVLDERAAAFIGGQDLFFLATADAAGRPTCSYKGGDPGFVRVVDERTLAFPNYDGNGMYLSAGNVLVNPNVGLLFLDLANGNRLRVDGTASIQLDDPLWRRTRGGAVRRPGHRPGRLPELPPLPPPLRAGRAFGVRPPRGGDHAGPGLEAGGLGRRRPARRRPGRARAPGQSPRRRRRIVTPWAVYE